jgi:hypothetical protein
MVGNMSFVLGFWNISHPSWHEFNVFEMSFLPFELEVPIDGDIEHIQEPIEKN